MYVCVCVCVCVFKSCIWGGEKLSLSSVFSCPEKSRFCSEATGGGSGKGSGWVGMPGIQPLEVHQHETQQPRGLTL